MGILITFFSYLVVGLLGILLAPLLYAFVTKKIIAFRYAGFKEYAYFWILLIFLGLIFQTIYIAFLQITFGLDQAHHVYSQNYTSVYGLSFLGLKVFLASWIFRETYWQAFKAALVYILILVVVLTCLFFVSMSVGFNMFAGG